MLGNKLLFCSQTVPYRGSIELFFAAHHGCGSKEKSLHVPEVHICVAAIAGVEKGDIEMVTFGGRLPGPVEQICSVVSH